MAGDRHSIVLCASWIHSLGYFSFFFFFFKLSLGGGWREQEQWNQAAFSFPFVLLEDGDLEKSKFWYLWYILVTISHKYLNDDAFNGTSLFNKL